MSRRTETAYKAIIRASQHNMTKSRGFRRHGKCRGCVATVHVLIRGDLLHMRFDVMKSAVIGNDCRDGAEVSRGRSRQGRHHSWRCGGWKRARQSRDGLTRRRTELEEGDVILHELPESLYTRPGTCMERVMGIQLPRIITVTAVLSKN